jgi:hypothetical protein
MEFLLWTAMEFLIGTGINHLVINQQRVHNATDLDQSLPLAAISSKPRNLSGRCGSDFPQTDLRDHAFKAPALHILGGGTTQIFIDDLDLFPTNLLETLTHSIHELSASDFDRLTTEEIG